ncbi:MAG: hypothetical protein SV186_01425 [Candidatus Nanohaloarchaea archaeon]|nr:hypothetical protein [Candidatus Nanohaloarchaea archaeon]
MDVKAFFKRRGYSGRAHHFVTALEDQVDELPDGYSEERDAFNSAVARFVRARTIHTFFTLLFYASVITSITASVGFKINVFERIYGVLGFTTVFLLYLAARYQMRLARADFENTRSRVIAYLTAAEQA